jgi:hypothetical protein
VDVALRVSISQGDVTGNLGFAREDLNLNEQVLLNADDPDGTVHWTVLDAPTNATVTAMSSAKDVTGTGLTLAITPDYAGTYYGTATDGVTTVEWSFYAGPALGALQFGEYFPRRVPAFRETLAHNVPDAIDLQEDGGNKDGWAREWRRWFAAINYLWARIQAMTSGFIAVMWNGIELPVARILCPPGYQVDGDTLLPWRGGTTGNPFQTINETPLVSEFYFVRFPASRHMRMVVGVRATYRSAAGVGGSVDRVMGVDFTTNASGAATAVTLMVDSDTNVKLLPSALTGLTCEIATRTFGFATTVTRPTGVAGGIVVEWHATTVIDMGAA